MRSQEEQGGVRGEEGRGGCVELDEEMELELLLGEQHWRQAITLLQHWGGLQLLQRHWHTLPAGSEAWLQRLGTWAPQLNGDPNAANLRLLGLLQLAPSTSEQIIALAERPGVRAAEHWLRASLPIPAPRG